MIYREQNKRHLLILGIENNYQLSTKIKDKKIID